MGFGLMQLLLPALVILGLIWFLKVYAASDPGKRKRLMAGFLFLIFFGLVLLLTVTGRLHYIAAVVTGLLPFVKKALPLLRYVPLLRRFVKQKQAQSSSDEGTNNSGSSGSSSQLSRAQALQILGLQEDATREEIVEAHRRLMQRCHPDRGGNDFLAAQLNAAKDTLLG